MNLCNALCYAECVCSLSHTHTLRLLFWCSKSHRICYAIFFQFHFGFRKCLKSFSALRGTFLFITVSLSLSLSFYALHLFACSTLLYCSCFFFHRSTIIILLVGRKTHSHILPNNQQPELQQIQMGFHDTLGDAFNCQFCSLNILLCLSWTVLCRNVFSKLYR